MIKSLAITIKKGDELAALEHLHNDATGPAARLQSFREGVRATLDILGINYKHFQALKMISFGA